jgi:uncharacterized protein (DUF1501 family)
MERFLNRRLFLQLGGMSLALTVADSALARGLAESRLRRTSLPKPQPPSMLPQDQLSTPTLITIFLRGGADGLNIAVPTEAGDHATYLSYRPNLGVTMPMMQGAGTLLTDAGGAAQDFGLHPSALALKQLWDMGYLILLPDVHYDNGSRSHFDSQQFFENGTPFKKFTPDGWANRHLATSPGGPALMRAIAFEYQTPFSMVGAYPTLAFAGLYDINISGSQQRHDNFMATQEQVYPMTEGGTKQWDPEMAVAGRDLVAAIRAVKNLEPLPDPNPASDYVTNNPGNGNLSYFGDRLKDLARLIKTNAFTIEMAEVDLQGWDTHNIQTTEQPPIIETLARDLKAFIDDVGDAHMQNIVFNVYTEFGRTARENGSVGTDHGSASLAMVIGHPSRVLGRRIVHGPSGWAGLTDLRDDRDIKYSVDYRDLIFESVSRHLGNSSPEIFPGYTATPLGLFA